MTSLSDPLVVAAAEFARAAHDEANHLRKYTDEPYSVHLEAVAGLVAEVTDDPEVVAVAWLHDTLEDTETEVDDLNDNFGSRVARLVEDLTDVSRPEDGNRKRRKSRDRGHLSHALPAAQTVKLADLIDNARSICAHDREFGEVFLGEMEGLLEILSKGNATLQERARLTVAECRGVLAQDTQVMEEAER
jgi:(p)ppGpp synthase/HD superfamily hydrolase